MLLLKLPLPLVPGTRGVEQGAIAMPLTILELPLIPTAVCGLGVLHSTNRLHLEI